MSEGLTLCVRAAVASNIAQPVCARRIKCRFYLHFVVSRPTCPIPLPSTLNATQTIMRHLTPPEAATLVLRIKPNAADMSPGWEVELPSPGNARARPLIGADARTRTWQTKGAWVYGRVGGERAAATYVWLI